MKTPALIRAGCRFARHPITPSADTQAAICFSHAYSLSRRPPPPRAAAFIALSAFTAWHIYPETKSKGA